MVKRVEMYEMLRFLSTKIDKQYVVGYMEDEGELKTILARDMRPSREDYERLGFVFSEIESDDVLCYGELPEGWVLEETVNSAWTNILDNNGMLRGLIFYNDFFFDRSAHMRLECRYGVRVVYLDDACNNSEVYFGSKEEKIYVAGQVYRNGVVEPEELMKMEELEERLKEKAKLFGDEYYPGWQNVGAYWDDGKVLGDGFVRRQFRC